MKNDRFKRRKHPEKIGNMVGALLAKWEGRAKKQEIIFNSLWKKIVGERIAKHTRLYQIRGQQLVIIAESSAWMNELTFLKEKIKIKAKNSFATYGINIEEVTFKLG